MAVTLVQILIFGVALGGVYALFASGLTLIYSVTKEFQVAHGDLLTVALFACFSLNVSFGLDPYVSILIVGPVFFVAGVLIYYTLFRPLMLTGPAGVFMGFLGVSWIMESVLRKYYGADAVSTPTAIGGRAVSVGSLVIPWPYLIAVAVSVVVTLVLHLILTRTGFGRSVRAIAENTEMAGLIGIDAKKIQALVCAVAFVLVAIAASLTAPIWSVDPFKGSSLLLFAFVVCTLGGLGSFVGALVAGLIIGVLQAVGDYYLGTALAPVFPYAAFVAVLLLKPEGLFTRK